MVGRASGVASRRARDVTAARVQPAPGGVPVESARAARRPPQQPSLPRPFANPRRLLALALLASGLAGGAVPVKEGALCPAPPLPPTNLPAPRDIADPRVHIDAAKTESTPEGATVLSGAVTVVQGDRALATERLEYSEAKGTVKAEGGVTYRDSRLTLQADRADVDIESSKGEFTNTEFQLNDNSGHGTAATLRALDANRTELEQLTFTGCPQGSEDWTMKAATMTLDRASGRGEAEDVTVRFFKVPLFYTPWMSFPVDERRLSGLLPPELSASDRHGTEVTIPYYWNIAPDQDATITFHPMTKRGLMFENEYRYLNEGSSGQVELDAMPHDQVTADTRARARYRHRGDLGNDWAVDMDLNAVSDPEYFEDYGSSLAATTQAYLPQRIDFLTSSVHYAFRARLLDYAVTDPTLLQTDEPYGKLPQLLVVAASDRSRYGLVYDVGAEFVRFQHDALVEGSRLDVKPRVSLPLRGPGWFVTPALAWRYTMYNLEQDPLFTEDVARETPIGSFDAGLLFERDVPWGGGLTQTLEPRLFYLKVPYRDQSDIPLFDTALPDVNLFQLFRDNRFIGADRQGDADQFSLAVTSRLIDPKDGGVLLTGSIGQITYFEDRQVTLGATPETLARSELIAELGTDPTRKLSLAAAAVFEPSNQDTTRSNVTLRWRPDERRRIDFSYRFRAGSVEQTDVAMVWPLNPNWHAIARWNYSMLDRDTLESLVGLEYESCCWALRVGARSYVFNRTGEKEQTIFLQLELKGLASVGEPLDKLLERGTSNHGIPEDL